MASFNRIILFCLLFLIEGCTPQVKIKLFNHTGGVVNVQANNQRITILQNSTGEFNYYSLTPTLPMSITFEDRISGDGIKIYNLITFPEAYVKPLAGGLKGYEVLFQIEPNGLIYVLPPESSTPIQNFDSQPSGYPLKPQL